MHPLKSVQLLGCISGNSVRDCDVCQTAATIERTDINACHTITDCDACQIAAPIECTISNDGQTVTNCDAGQTAATTERPIGNCGYACRNDYACDRYAVERPSPIVVKPSGKLMLARFVQQKNAWTFMVVILSGRTTPVIVVFSWEACAPISLTGMPL